MHHRTLHRALLLGAFTAAAAAGALAWDSAAHAAEKPSAIEQPGQLVDKVLPEQASERAKDVVAQVRPKPKPAKAPRDEPAPQPADPPAEAPPADRDPTPKPPADPIVKVPPVDLPPAAVDPIAIDPIVVDVQPAPAPPAPAVTLPAIDPTPIPDGYLAPAIPVPVSAVELLTGPAPTTRTVDAGTPATSSVATLLQAILCDDHDPLDMVRPVKHVKQDDKPASATPPGEPCPGTPGNPAGPDATRPAVKTGSGNGADLIAQDVGAAHGQPALDTLRALWPRSELPAGRTEHPEPGPA